MICTMPSCHTVIRPNSPCHYLAPAWKTPSIALYWKSLLRVPTRMPKVHCPEGGAPPSSKRPCGAGTVFSTCKRYGISRIGVLFKVYVDTWLKLKEASGWPDGCTTPDQWKALIDAYRAREGIFLDPAHIAKNPGQRVLAKRMLSSMWGKFDQRLNNTQVREFTLRPSPAFSTATSMKSGMSEP